MKGIIFDLLEEVVTRDHGEPAWDAMLDAAGVEGAYTAVGSYPHEELFALVGAASKMLSIEPEALVRWFGGECIPLLAARFPGFFEPHSTTRAFLLTLNDVIHPEVRKLFPGAYAPSFAFEEHPDSLALSYESHRNLCSFAEGLIEGSARHFGEKVEITQSACKRRGDERCVIVTKFSESA